MPNKSDSDLSVEYPIKHVHRQKYVTYCVLEHVYKYLIILTFKRKNAEYHKVHNIPYLTKLAHFFKLLITLKCIDADQLEPADQHLQCFSLNHDSIFIMKLHLSHVVTSGSCILNTVTPCNKFYKIQSGAQWLSGRVLGSRPKGRGFEPHQRHCVVSLSKNINPCLVLVQPRKTRPFITERLLMGLKESNQTNKYKT